MKHKKKTLACILRRQKKITTNGVLHEMSKQYMKKDKEDNTDDSNRFSKANQNNISLTS